MTEQNETQEIESNTNESKINEVIIVKKRTFRYIKRYFYKSVISKKIGVMN